MSNSTNYWEQKGSGAGTSAYVYMMIGVTALAFTAPWVKLTNFEPATAAILRCLTGLIGMLPFAFYEMKKMGLISKQGIILSLVGGLFLGVDFTAWNYSIHYVGSGIATILLNLQVIILPALAFFIDKERVSRSYLIVVPIMIFGVALSGGVFDPVHLDPMEGVVTHVYGMPIAILGTICGMTSGCCYGVYLYGTRKASRVNHGQIIQPIFFSTIAQLVAPTLFLSLFNIGSWDITNGMMVDGKLPLNPETTVGDPITIMNWVWMIVLGLLGQALAWTLVQYGSARMNPAIAAGLLILRPVATVFIAFFLFTEIPSSYQIIGTVIVLSAVAYQNGIHTAIIDWVRGNKNTA